MAINSGSTSTPIAVYGYDALGRRILKGTQSAAILNTTRYVYDGDEVIEERDGAGVVAASMTPPHYCAALHRDSCTSIVITRNGTNYWPATDADGSTLALTLDNGSVAERYDYADYGEPAFFDGAGNALSGGVVGNPYLFNGTRHDSESGLYHCGSRDCEDKPMVVRVRYDMSATHCQIGVSADPRLGTTLQRFSGDRSASSAVFAPKLLIQTKSAGKTSGGDGMRLD